MLCVNRELKMGAGKTAAQCAHAAAGVVEELMARGDVRLKHWQTFGATKIAIKIPTERELIELRQQAVEAGIPHYLVVDAGRTQIAAGSRTVLALGPAGKTQLDELTGTFSLL
eukprot:jgi/Astpho2/7019/Aster-01873